MNTRLDTARELWRRGQRGFPESYPVAQVPNAPLLLALVASLVSRFVGGDAYGYARGAFALGLGAWAWLELSQGSNAFRRLLGVAGAVYLVVTLGQDLA